MLDILKGGFRALKRLVIGQPLASHEAEHQRLPKIIALPVFASDALSSVAYATEELLKALAPVLAISAITYIPQLTSAIIGLLAVVTISYVQTLYAYPTGGGAYIVAKANLGTMPGLIAAASLLIDYSLTVAVSAAAGVEALISAFPVFLTHRVGIASICVCIIGLANLRGMKESGKIFAVPTYGFIVALGGLVMMGLYKVVGSPPVPHTTAAVPVEPNGWLLLTAFASGCSALTGIEAISDGITAFQKPVARNASITMAWMSGILAFLFIAVSYLAGNMDRLLGSQAAVQTAIQQVCVEQHQSLISVLARGICGDGWYYYVVQIATMAILFVAANTCFADFPRLASLLARDQFLPRQFQNVGDRLVFSNGIVALCVVAIGLLHHYGGSTHALIPLYAVGVFISFTLSQAGMVRYWMRHPDGAKPARAALNGFGALVTFVVLCVTATTKFMHGAWIVMVLIPCIVMVFLSINRHYADVQRQLALAGAEVPSTGGHTVLLPLSHVHRGVLHAISYARSINANVQAITIDTNPIATSHLEEVWLTWGQGIPLVVLESPYRSLLGPMVDYIRSLKARKPDEFITVVLPEFVVAKWWHNLLHNQSAFLLRAALLFEPRVVVTSIRIHLEH